MKSRATQFFQIACILALAASFATDAFGQPVDGFTEPFRTIRVASPESGIVAKVLVNEGDTVQSGQPLVALDDELHRMLLQIAKQQMDSAGSLKSATAELELHTNRARKLAELRSTGQAHQQEVDRARTDVEIAEGRLLAIQEELALRKLEYRKIEVQLQRRTVTAPVDGVVTAITKNPGEFVSPVDGEVLTVVQLQPLRATFLMNRAQAAKVRVGQKVAIQFPDESLSATGIIDQVSKLTDAESGTIPIKVNIDNRDGKYRSGERCTLDVSRTIP